MLQKLITKLEKLHKTPELKDCCSITMATVIAEVKRLQEEVRCENCDFMACIVKPDLTCFVCEKKGGTTTIDDCCKFWEEKG